MSGASGDEAASTGHHTLHARFQAAMQAVQMAARAGEVSTGWLDAEVSDFIRFNHGKVRQSGTVDKASIRLRLVSAGRQASLSQTLTGTPAVDQRLVHDGFERLRQIVGECEPDPYLALSDQCRVHHRVQPTLLPEPAEVCDLVCNAAGDADLVGFYAGGPLACAYVSSQGHSLWHETCPWFFDYSIHTGGDKAVKVTLSDAGWQRSRVADSIAGARRDAQILLRPVKQLSPGEYRAFLSPAAVADLVGMMNWGGFSASAQASGHSPLARLKEGAERFNPAVTLRDDLAALGVPRFQTDGFERPDSLTLVEAGLHSGSLVSPRSAREFGLVGNGATTHEVAQALSMQAGQLDETQALARVGTGVAVSNFWYLNWSDRAAARMTGMTRFASLWVEGGEAVAPLAVMRFDDSLYRMLGDQLEALGSQVHRLPDTQSYESRSFGAMQVPAALLSSLRFTL